MKMHVYLKEIEHAATETLRLARSERKRLEDFEAHLSGLRSQVEDSRSRIEWLNQNPDFDDDFQTTYMTYESYFGPEKELYYSGKTTAELQGLLDVRKFSTGALGGNMLQYGKQAISFVHSKLSACPDGRTIGTQPLKSIIWQGRNQALHWEEGSFTPPVVTCFEALAKESDPKFGEFRVRNMATDVIALVDWKEFADFERDMLLLS